MFIALGVFRGKVKIVVNLPRSKIHKFRMGYIPADLELIRAFGPASGYISVLVLTLYINSTAGLELYERPTTLWLIAPLVLYWVTRIWFLADRGEMSDDPIAFTIKDPATYVTVALVGLVLIAAAI